MKNFHIALSLTAFAAFLLPSCSDAVDANVSDTDDSGVSLIEAGSSPRRALRFSPTKGQKQTVDMTMKMTMEMVDLAPPIPMGMKFTMEAETTAVNAEGFEITTRVNEASLTEEFTSPMVPIDTVNSELSDGMIGMTTIASYTSRGIMLKNDMDMSTLSPAIRQQMEGMKEAMGKMSVPFPKEEVGVGALWTYMQEITANNIEMTQKVTYELIDIKGDLVTISIQTEALTEPQTIDIPDQPGVKMRLESMTAIGSGQSVFNLKKSLILPEESTMEMESSMDSIIEMGAEEQPMSMNIGMEIEVKSRQ